MKDFDPSLFAEIDWQEFRPDIKNDNRAQILNYIDNYVSFSTILANIAYRDPAGLREAFTEAELTDFEPLFIAWHQGWLGQGRPALLTQLDRYIESVRRQHWEPAEAAIQVDAERTLSAALMTLTDLHRLPNVIETILSNACFRFLDLPWTRRRTKAAIRTQMKELGRWAVVGAAPDGQQNDPQTLRAQLQTCADIARRVNHHSLESLLNSSVLNNSVRRASQ